MIAHRLPFAVLLLLVSCGTVRDWRELQTDPMTIGEAYDGLVHVANGQGFVADASETDRGMGVWQSRWRERTLPPTGRPGRYRLRAEFLVDEGSAAAGWPLRFAVEQQQVEDLRRSMQPREEDWSALGQDRESEAILGDKLQRRLAPKSVAPRRDDRRAP